MEYPQLKDIQFLCREKVNEDFSYKFLKIATRPLNWGGLKPSDAAINNFKGFIEDVDLSNVTESITLDADYPEGLLLEWQEPTTQKTVTVAFTDEKIVFEKQDETPAEFFSLSHGLSLLAHTSLKA